MRHVLIFTFLLLTCAQLTSAQNLVLKGVLKDKADSSALKKATIRLTSPTDNTFKKQAFTDNNGAFEITGLNAQPYLLTISFLGYGELVRAIMLQTETQDLGVIKMPKSSRELKEVVIKGQVPPAQQKGDTLAFNADAYKTNPDASGEDLVKKMPGITVENGNVKAQGEDVRKVLVDGKEFFGEDATLALRNLPAEAIQRIEVFDRMSDQAQFTGFDDGNSQKTINIVTRAEMKTSQFGKMFAGYGTDGRYNAGGNINLFNGDRQISIIGLTNNINQQNFSIADIMGVMSNSGGGQGGPGPGGGGPPGGGNMMINAGRNNNSFGGGPGGLLTGNQSGITKTNSVGLNYSDEWGKKIKVSGSYFFNNTDNKNTSDIDRSYFNSNGLTYTEHNSSQTKNDNHRVNFRFEYTIDSANALIITPQLSYQGNNYTTGLQGMSRVGDGVPAGTTVTDQQADNKGYSFNNNILYQHRFARKGRTVSLNITTRLNSRNGRGSYYSSSLYAGDTSTSILDQRYDLHTNSHTVTTTLSYTEPVGKKAQLMASYSPSFSGSTSDKSTNDRDTVTGLYDAFNSSLSNKYESSYNTHQGGLSYRFSDTKLNFMLGTNLQYAQLAGEQQYPGAFSIQRSFTSVLPTAMLNYKFSRTRNLNIMYRTANNAPTITQLQNVSDVSNPLQITTGNPQLEQTSEHNLMMRYGTTNLTAGRSFFVFANGAYVNNYIGNATFIPLQDTVFEGHALNRGSQLTRPVNVDGYYSGRAFAVYSLPVKQVRSNVNLNAGVTYTHTPSLINGWSNTARSTVLNGGAYIGSNISSNLDFSLSYNASYNIVKNTLQTGSDNTYYNHTAGFKINWIFLKGVVLNTDITHTLYHGLSSGFDQSYFLWNAYIGYKFLKDRSLEAKVSVYDILNQNKSVSRTVSETYTQDTRTQVLQRYGMVTLTYTLRNFKKGMPQQNKFEPPPGMPPPGKDGAPQMIFMPPPGG